MRRSIGFGLAVLGMGVGTFLVIAEGCSGPSPAKVSGASTRALQELLGKLLDRDPSDAVVTQMIARGVPAPMRNTTIHPTNAKAPIIPEVPEDIACIGGFLVPMPAGGWDAKFRGAKAAFPCGSADTATTACDPAANAIPFPDGDVVLTWTVLTGDARSRWASPASSTNELGTAFTFADNAPEYLPASASDFYGGTKKWWIGGPVTGTPALPIVTAKRATGGDQSTTQSPTTARVLVRENAVVFVQALSEVGATPQGFRQSTFLDNSTAVKDWSGDVFPEPRAEAPFPSTGPGCTSGPIIIKEDAFPPPPPDDDAGDAGPPPPKLIGVIPGTINQWNICRGKPPLKGAGIVRLPNPDGGEEEIVIDLGDYLKRILRDAGGLPPLTGTPAPVTNGGLDIGDLRAWYWGRRSKLGDGGFYPDGGLIDGTRLVEILPDGGIQYVTEVATDPDAQPSGVAATPDGVTTTINSETGSKVMFFGKTGALTLERSLSDSTAGTIYRINAINAVGTGSKVAIGGLRIQGAARDPWMTILTTPNLEKQAEIVAPIALPGIRINDTKATDTSIAMCGSVTDQMTGAAQPILMIAKLDDLANVGLFRLTFPSLGANVFTEVMTCELTPPTAAGSLKWGLHYVGNAEVAPQSFKPFVGTAQITDDQAMTLTTQDLALHPVIGARSFADGCLIATGPQSGLFTHTSDNGASRIVVFDGLNVGADCPSDQKPTPTPTTSTRTAIAAQPGASLLTTTAAPPFSAPAPSNVSGPPRSLTTQLICE